MQSENPVAQTGNLSLCLDLANTVDWRGGARRKDGLKTFRDLLEWSLKNGLIDREESRRLAARARSEAGLETRTMRDMDEFREATYRVFSAVAHGSKLDANDLEILNQYLARSLARSKIEPSGATFRWAWTHEDRAADAMLWPIARSVADLLTSEELRRVKECANEEEGCGFLFVDQTKNQKKRWCRMDSCGNRAKFRRYYEKHNRPKKE